MWIATEGFHLLRFENSNLAMFWRAGRVVFSVLSGATRGQTFSISVDRTTNIFPPKFCQQTYEYLHMNTEAFVSNQLSEWFLQLWQSQWWRVVSRQANLLKWASPLIIPVLFLSKPAKMYMPWPMTISRLAILLFHTYNI